MAKRYYEFKDKASSKFWEIDTKGKTVTVRFGKIGTDGQTTVKKFATPKEATAHARKVTAEKVKKGYKSRRASMGKRSKRAVTPPKPKEVVVYGNMEWWNTAEPPKSFADLPKAFNEAYELWRQNRETHADRIVSLLSPFIGAMFVPENVNGWEELIAVPAGGVPEFEAEATHLTGVDFSTRPFPRVKAEAIFRVPVTRNFGNGIDQDAWENEHDFFHTAVIFRWQVPRTERTEDLDFTFGSHSGCECIFDAKDKSITEGWHKTAARRKQ